MYLFVVELNLSYSRIRLVRSKKKRGARMMIPTEMQWNALLQRHATVTVHAKGQQVTGDLYNVTDEQVILIVPNKQELFEVISRADIDDISW
ncbi:hypothetical protein P4S95_06820 [Aneurinibacillus aneurinilyticus]|jgi:hypothetical protein|uniref:DUF2642 domain-containing protein n=2 Tax=Aneurinibacillus aneurinilyticus TaxID=1391 RepID=U1YGX3_ANEAE|nr:hypothetical protein [Aneurinibacillus aneurinilyticus]ERI10051.1 hypothetical protein HMPREF0083_01812 [Aneurinibacillus aneurinilyticus ATCC 12856]MED0669936.1 hypothetical protein [Aneurinibacillus aneurinilyticus]